MARIKLDEDLSPLVGEPFRERGHEVMTVVGQKWAGLPDAVLWQRIVQEQELFLTADKGFGDVRAYPPGTHVGIIVLRPDRQSLPEFRRLAEMLVQRQDLDRLRGTVTIVTSRRIRIRRV